MHTVLPEYALARGKIGNTAELQGRRSARRNLSRSMPWEQLAYVQIDLVGCSPRPPAASSTTAARGRRNTTATTSPPSRRSTSSTTSASRRKARATRRSKLPGREETEFIRSKDMWWRPIEVRVGPDGAMYVGRFLQPGRHPQRHARPRPQQGQRRRPPRPRPLLRPHLEDRAQAGEEARGAGFGEGRRRRAGEGAGASEPRMCG